MKFTYWETITLRIRACESRQSHKIWYFFKSSKNCLLLVLMHNNYSWRHFSNIAGTPDPDHHHNNYRDGRFARSRHCIRSILIAWSSFFILSPIVWPGASQALLFINALFKPIQRPNAVQNVFMKCLNVKSRHFFLFLAQQAQLELTNFVWGGLTRPGYVPEEKWCIFFCFFLSLRSVM